MKQRYHILDEIRGITLCSMIMYHAAWDLVYMFGRNWAWYRSDFAYFWQQSICWSFILLSGFCFSLGKRKLRRGLTIFGAGVVISLVTEIFMPANRIRFGVLTLLGSCMLIMTVAEWIAVKIGCRENKLEGNDDTTVDKGAEISERRRSEVQANSRAWLILSFLTFALTKRINYGYLGFADVKILDLPESLYEMGDFGTFLGFTESTFYSTDYFSLMPWFFLFLTGFFLQKWFLEKEWITGLGKLPSLGKWWRFMGKHSLLIYMLHQPVLYGLLYLLA